jgi:hypothetical protein
MLTDGHPLDSEGRVTKNGILEHERSPGSEESGGALKASRGEQVSARKRSQITRSMASELNNSGGGRGRHGTAEKFKKQFVQ